MVIRIGAGEVGASVSQLVKDVRYIMEPDTAKRLKERRSNRLRDYAAMTGPLGVTHLLLFSRSDSGNTNLRLALTPRGPTLHFRIQQYSLAKDVRNAQRHPQGGAKDFLTAPLLVLNNFTSPALGDNSQGVIPKQLESLTTTVFQSLFPPISPQATPLSSVRRVLLVDRKMPKSGTHVDDGSYTLNLRHYVIKTKRTGLSRSVRRLDTAGKHIKQPGKHKRAIPCLGKFNDVAEYLLDPSAAVSDTTSASESEIGTDAEVEVLQREAKKVLNKQQMAAKKAKDGRGSQSDKPGAEKRAVKLVELGPRMELRMTKVEEGLCGGKVMWHEYINKTPEETTRMEKVWDTRRRAKEERRQLQKENIAKKRRGKGSAKDSGTADSKDSGKRDDLPVDIDEEEEEEEEEEEKRWDSEVLEADEGIEINRQKAAAD